MSNSIYKLTAVTVVVGILACILIFWDDTILPTTSPQSASVYVYDNIHSDPTETKETETLENSDNPVFWLNSGALIYSNGNTSRTLNGDLPRLSSWRRKYAESNPVDTDSGYHPQNIFRLITKDSYENSMESMYFLIVQDNLSQSPNRNDSNGVFLISRYKNSNNLYYMGVRVDGTAVIKKKINGVYHTLSQVQLFGGDKYNRDSHPSLLPKNQWIGLKADVQNVSSDKVHIDLFVDKNNSGTWTKVLSINDITVGDILPIFGSGHGGIRSDFMDIQFKDFSLENISLISNTIARCTTCLYLRTISKPKLAS